MKIDQMAKLDDVVIRDVAEIMQDIANGETPILLTDLPSSGLIPSPRGKPLHKRVPFRWASRGCRGVKLPVLRTPTGLATTQSRVIQFLTALSEPARMATHSRKKGGQ